MAHFIPNEIIQEIMQRTDIVELVGEYVPLQRRGRNYFGLCPFHQEDTPSFSVNAEKQIYKCFGCGKGGNVIGFVQEIENLGFIEAVHKLAERAGVTIPTAALSAAEQARQAERQAMLAAHQAAAEFYAGLLPQNSTALAYLKRRGIELDIARRFGLGVAPEADWQALYQHLTAQGYGEQTLLQAGLIGKSGKNGRCYDKFHGRLIFPIRDYRSAAIAFGGRAMRDEQPKYLNSQSTPIYNKSQHLFALDIAAPAIRAQKQVVIMEGYMDVLTAHQFGVANAVASLGTAFTTEHIRLLNRYAPEPPEKLAVILAFDGDAAGQKAARASLEKLMPADAFTTRVMVFPDQLDPDDFLHRYGGKGWQRLLQKYCYPALDWLLLLALEKRDTESAADKGAVVAELKPAINRLRNQTEKADFIRTLSRRLQVAEDAIRADLAPKAGPGSLSREAPLTRPAPAAPARAGRAANRYLLALAIGDENIFRLAARELGADFASTEEEGQLITYIDALGADYDWNPAALFNQLGPENEGLRQFLLKLIQADYPQNADEKLARDYIRTIKKQLLQQRLRDLQREIAAAETAGRDTDQLNAEKYRLTLEELSL